MRRCRVSPTQLPLSASPSAWLSSRSPSPRPSPLVPSVPSCCYEVSFQGAICLSWGLGGVSTWLPAGPWPVPSVLLGPSWAVAGVDARLGPADPVITLSQHLPGSRGSSGQCPALRGASSLTGRCVPCPSLCRWMQACTLGTAAHAAHGACPLPWGQHGPCVRLVIRSPCLPTCSLSAPRSPAQQSLCPGLRAPKVDWHPCPSLSKTKEGRRGPGRLVGGETRTR